MYNNGIIRVNFLLFCAAFICAVVFSSCSSNSENQNEETGKYAYVMLAKEKYSGDINYLSNKERTFVICVKRNKTNSVTPHSTINFFVYDIRSGNIIYEEERISAEVGWKDNTGVQVSIIPEIINEDDPPNKNDFIFDVKLKKKIFFNK